MRGLGTERALHHGVGAHAKMLCAAVKEMIFYPQAERVTFIYIFRCRRRCRMYYLFSPAAQTYTERFFALCVRCVWLFLCVAFVAFQNSQPRAAIFCTNEID